MTQFPLFLTDRRKSTTFGSILRCLDPKDTHVIVYVKNKKTNEWYAHDISRELIPPELLYAKVITIKTENDTPPEVNPAIAFYVEIA